VVEKFNSAGEDLFYGKAGDLAGDDREHAEVSAPALHLVAAAIAYLNTVMIQIAQLRQCGGQCVRRTGCGGSSAAGASGATCMVRCRWKSTDTCTPKPSTPTSSSKKN
jgi:hypothetical protein